MECILNVLHGLPTRLARDSNNIKSHIKIDAMVAHISVGSLHNLIYLIIRNSIYSITITITFARLHLYNGQRIVLLSHNIKFFVPNSPVAITYGISPCHEISRCAILANSSKIVMLCHKEVILSPAKIAHHRQKSKSGERRE